MIILQILVLKHFQMNNLIHELLRHFSLSGKPSLFHNIFNSLNQNEIFYLEMSLISISLSFSLSLKRKNNNQIRQISNKTLVYFHHF